MPTYSGRKNILELVTRTYGKCGRRHEKRCALWFWQCPFPFCHILLQNMISLCSNWIQFLECDVPTLEIPTPPQNFPSCHDSIYRSISVFRTRCLFLLGYFPFGSFLNGSGYFQRAIVIFWVREIVRPSYPPRLLAPPPAFPFLRVKANEARDRPKRRPFCWRYFLPLFHSQCVCLFRFDCACIWRNFNNLVLNWKYKIVVFKRGSWLYRKCSLIYNINIF